MSGVFFVAEPPALRGGKTAAQATVLAHLQPGETAKTLPGHHTGAVAVICHAERKPQLLMPDGSRRDVVPETDYLVETPKAWRLP